MAATSYLPLETYQVKLLLSILRSSGKSLVIQDMNLLWLHYTRTKKISQDFFDPSSMEGAYILTNAEFVAKKSGAFFTPCKKNAKTTGLNTWAYLYRLWCAFSDACQSIYHQRNKVEAVFSALKNRYGDRLYATTWYMRRREMAMRFIAYNVRIIIGLQIAREKGIPLWVRA